MISYFIEFNRRLSKSLERTFPNFFGQPVKYRGRLMKIIQETLAEAECNSVLEVGGVDRPLLKKSKGYKYVGMDIDERPTCYECYDEFIVQSIEDRVEQKFDLVFSLTLLEHVPNNELSMESIYNCLNKNGKTVHYVPSKNHFYSICLRLVGPKIQKYLISKIRPEASEVSGYPAFFNYCSPKEMEKLATKVGFRSVDVIPFYKATDYFSFFLPLYIIVSIFENTFQLFKLSHFSSGFIIVARK